MMRRIFAGGVFRDRVHAGRVLAERLDDYRDRDDVIVEALPRGGVPVAAEVADRLGAPMDVALVRKLGVPWQPELAAGAIATDGVTVLNPDVIGNAGLTSSDIERVISIERIELRRREAAYRQGRPAVDVRGKTVIVVDDGIATGATMRAAIQVLRARGAASVIVAIPVGPPGADDEFPLADTVICLANPASFRGVGSAYDRFEQTSDEEVRAILGWTPAS